jgi:CDP-diacylglycerol--glycerol-3-phosphate 3-phosphatidyltransferase
LLKQDTPVGRQLDPLIDKVIVSGCYIYLATVPGTGVAPWMVTAIVVRELLIQGLRSHLEGQGQAFGARAAGKLKTVVQCLSSSAVLYCLTLSPSAPWAWFWLRDGLTWLAVGLTLYSGMSYIWIAFPKLRGET